MKMKIGYLPVAFGVFAVVIIGLLAVNYLLPGKLVPKDVSSWEECLQSPGSRVQMSYPGVCVTADGREFVQPLSDEEKKKLQPPEDEKGWQTFTDPTYGFTFQYPPSLTPSPGKDSPPERLLSVDFAGPSGDLSRSFYVIVRESTLPLAIEANNRKAQVVGHIIGVIFGQKDIIVDNTAGVQQEYFIQKEPTRKSFIVLLVKGRYLYEFSFPAPSDPNYPDLVLSTFKFISGSSTGYTCPQTEWIDCMPGPRTTKPQCSPKYLQWAQDNCPGFQGAAY